MSKLLLNKNTDGSEIVLDQSNVLKAFSRDGVSNVEYLHDEDGYRRTVQVRESLSGIADMSSVLISVTLDDGSIVYVNKDRINNVYDESSLANILYENEGTNLEKIKLSITSADVKNSIINKDGQSSFLNLSFSNAPEVLTLDTSVGDVTSQLTTGVTFTVFGEGNDNDNIYTVSSSSFNGSETEITVNEVFVVAGASNGGYTWVQ